MVSLQVLILRLSPLFFVMHLAYAAILFLVAFSVFFANCCRAISKKPSCNPFFCAPARPPRLRGCHGFCPAGRFHRIPKNPASPLRKRSAVMPTSYGIPFGTPVRPDAQRGAVAVNALLSSVIFQQAIPFLQLFSCFFPSRFCGLCNKKVKLWACSPL